MVVITKLLGVKKKASVLLSSRVMLEAIPNLVNLAIKFIFFYLRIYG